TYRLLTLTNHLNRQAMHILETQASLRLPEWRCLAFIHQCSGARGKASLHEVADETAMDRGLVTRSVQGLVSKGRCFRFSMSGQRPFSPWVGFAGSTGRSSFSPPRVQQFPSCCPRRSKAIIKRSPSSF
ncbi:MAG: MarR family winged helix-turn-helix transcriptional regulator, partial [Verrucomicrobiota bacterium]